MKHSCHLQHSFRLTSISLALDAQHLPLFISGSCEIADLPRLETTPEQPPHRWAAITIDICYFPRTTELMLRWLVDLQTTFQGFNFVGIVPVVLFLFL